MTIRSDEIKDLVSDFIAVQKIIQNPINSANNPYFHSKYASLDEILKMVRPILTEHNLAVAQNVGGNGESIWVSTILMHKTGQFLESDPLVLKMSEATNPQKGGSNITYARRYSLTALLGIFGEEDDDGNIAAHGDVKPKVEAKPRREEGKPFVRQAKSATATVTSPKVAPKAGVLDDKVSSSKVLHKDGCTWPKE